MALDSGSADHSPVSLTGYYTGEVWVRNGLSPAAMSTGKGRTFYRALMPLEGFARGWLGLSLEAMLVQRHRLIDEMVLAFVEQHPNAQVLELACGVSDRARRVLARAGPELTYIETDLPDVVAYKRGVYEQQQGSEDERHRLVPCNIVRTEGPSSPEAVIGGLDTQRPLVVISEGLLNYFSLERVEQFLHRLSGLLSRFPNHRYITEIWPRLPDYPGTSARQTMIRVIESLTRQAVPLHYDDDADIARAFREAGFSRMDVVDPDAYTFPSEVPTMTKPALFRIVTARAGNADSP